MGNKVNTEEQAVGNSGVVAQASSVEMAVGEPEQGLLVKAIQELQAATVEQNKQLKKQLKLTRMCAIFMAGMLAVVAAAVMVIIPKTSTALDQVNGVLASIGPTVESLSKVDIEGTMTRANALIEESRHGISEGLEQLTGAQSKIEAFDIDTLNKAIKDLESIIRPMANLFG